MGVLCDSSLSSFDWKLQDAFGRTVLHWICAHGFSDILGEVIDSTMNQMNSGLPVVQQKDNENGNEQDGDEKKENENGNQSNDAEKVENSKESVFNLQNKSGQTCLHWAVDKQQWYSMDYTKCARCARILKGMQGD